MRNHWIAAIAASVALSACAGRTDAPVADAAPGEVQAACYLQSDAENRWQRMESWDEGACFNLDSCNGGIGQSSGGCAKWARGPNAPALPWSAEFESASHAGAWPGADAPPLEHGLFADRSRCASDCPQTRWRAVTRVPLFVEPDPNSRIVGRINVDETVTTVEYVRYFAPMRGVVVHARDGLLLDEVVYQLTFYCDTDTVWRRGDVITLGAGAIHWDGAPQLHNPSQGDWVRLARSNGQRGWARMHVLHSDLLLAETLEPAPSADEAPAVEDDYWGDCE